MDNFKEENKKNKIICVLGMHRSGTSMIIRLLNLCGVYIGVEDDLRPASKGNELGHWEHGKIYQLDEEILELFGGSWHNPPKFPEKWEEDKRLKPLYKRAKKIIERMNREAKVWAIKEPRMCLTLPFWKKIVPDMIYVIPVRNQLDVARSLKKRNGFNLSKGMLLWSHYWYEILKETQGQKRIFTVYRDYFSDYKKALFPVVEFINSPLVKSEAHEEKIERFINPDYIHHKSKEKSSLEKTQKKISPAGNFKEMSFMKDLLYNLSFIYKKSKKNKVPLLKKIKKLKNKMTKERERHIKLTGEKEKQVENLKHTVNLKEKRIDNFRHIVALQEKEIEFMKSSKFWKLREIYMPFKLKIKRVKFKKYFKKAVDFFKPFVPKFLRRKFGHIYNNLFLVKYDSGFSLDNIDSGYRKGRKEIIYDIFNFSIISWNFRIQRPQHICRGLAANNNRIFYIRTQLIPARRKGLSYNQIKNLVRIEKAEENIYKINLVSKNNLNVYRDIIKDPDDLLYLKLSIEAIKNKFLIGDSISKVDLPFWGKLALVVKNTKIIYDCMDEHSGFENNSEIMTKEEDKLIKRADLVLTTADILFKKVSKRNKNVLMLKNAGEVDKFKRLKKNNKIRNIKKPIVGYYGAISSWFDFDLVEYCARKKPEINFVLIGRICENSGYHRVKKLPNVFFLGEKPYEEITDYLYHFDVCTIPFKIIPLTMATNPVKFFEYISSGKSVVSVDLPELREHSNISYISKNKKEFLDNIDKALTEKDKSVIERRKKIAQNNTWEKRSKVLLDKINSLLYPKISLIIITYNNLGYTKKCLESIFSKTSYPNYEVILIDNNSSDGTPEYLKKIKRENINVKVVLNLENRGFAGGNNDGLNVASGDYLVLINNDTIVTKNWLNDLKKVFDENPQLGVLGPVSNSVGNIQMIKVGYKEIGDMDQWAEGYTKDKKYSYNKMKMLGFFCVMLRREVYEKVGKLDENYGVGMFEDDDYCERVARAGYKLGYTEKVFIHHFGSASFKKLKDEKYRKIFNKNKAYFEKKWGRKWIPNIDGKIKVKEKNGEE